MPTNFINIAWLSISFIEKVIAGLPVMALPKTIAQQNLTNTDVMLTDVFHWQSAIIDNPNIVI